nr:MAG TPA: hypothetical protein [Caudoviricetes sp.]
MYCPARQSNSFPRSARSRSSRHSHIGSTTKYCTAFSCGKWNYLFIFLRVKFLDFYHNSRLAKLKRLFMAFFICVFSIALFNVKKYLIVRMHKVFRQMTKNCQLPSYTPISKKRLPTRL